MIRRATISDIPTMLRYGRVMHSESRYKAHAWEDEKVRALIEQLIASDDGLALVAVHGSEIVGGFLGVVDEHYFTHARVANDFAMFVAPDKRGQFIATQLLELYIAWAKSRGAAMIQFGVSTGVNTEATARLAEMSGFERVGLLLEVSSC